MLNVGKIFENQFKKSIPDYALLYRIPDQSQSFQKSDMVKFVIKNPFDFILWDKKRRNLYALELKTVQGKYVSFERLESQNSTIHLWQIEALREWSTYDVIAGFIIEFRDFEKTIFLEITEFDKFFNTSPKKSFTLEDLDKYNIKYTTLSQKKARKYFTYDVDSLLAERGNNVQ